MKEIRLAKYLAAAGIASRRACETIISEGRVTVNKEIALLPQTLVNPSKDKVAVDGKIIKSIEKKVYFLLNKPVGYVCSQKRLQNEKLVLDLFEDEPHRLFTVGRLDKDTQGLLLVTNDGHFANSIIHPSKQIVREYLVKSSLDIEDHHLKAISKGTLVEGVPVKPVSVKKVRRGTLKISVKEGRKHEVRLLMEVAGLPLKELTRIRLGNLHLGKLPSGTYRPLSEKEIDSFMIS